MCDIVEFNGNVLPKRRRSQSDIDRNIQDTAARRPHELSLRLYKLIVESTHYAIARAGMVVLHKGRNSMLSANRVAEGFHEKAARVAETLDRKSVVSGKSV